METIFVKVEYICNGIPQQKLYEVKRCFNSLYKAKERFAYDAGIEHALSLSPTSLFASTKSVLDKQIYRITQIKEV